MGTPEEGASFFAERWPEARSVSDAHKQIYAAFGLGHGSLSQVAGPRVWIPSLLSLVRGRGLGKPVGDPRVMSAWFLVDEGYVRWEHRHETIGAKRRYGELLHAYHATRAPKSRVATW